MLDNAAIGPIQSEECLSKTEGKERRGRDEETEEDGKKEGEEENGEGNPNLSSLPMTGLPLAGALFGMCLGGPVGLLAGVKLGGVAAVGGLRNFPIAARRRRRRGEPSRAAVMTIIALLLLLFLLFLLRGNQKRRPSKRLISFPPSLSPSVVSWQ